MYSRTLRRRRRSGVITFLMAVALLVIVAISALAVDGGLLYLERRTAQGAADSAAMAGAYELYQAALDVNSTGGTNNARTEALLTAQESGFDTSHAKVTVNIPPVEGAYAGKSGYIEVVIESDVTGSFSNIFAAGSNRVKARSVAAGTLLPTKASVLVLDPKRKNALHMSKKGTLLNTQGDVIVNSKNKKAANISKDSQIIAENVIFTAKLEKKLFNKIRAQTRGDIKDGVTPTEDPFANLTPPDPGEPRKLSDLVQTQGDKNIYTLKPGTYSERLKFDKNDIVIMEPGNYTLQKEFEVKKNAVLEGYNVMLYSNGKRKVKFESSDITLTPPNSGPYTDISIYMEPGKKGKVEFKKDANIDMSGVIYGPNAEVKFSDTDFSLDGDSDEDEVTWDEDEEEEDLGYDDGSPSTTGSIGASIVAYKLKIDKKSHVNVLGDSIPARLPVLRIVE